MFSDLESLASILDEHIVKALAKPSRIAKLESDIIKGLSHDPFNPVSMTEDSSYYNPYRSMSDGSFLPYPVEHWEEQGRNAEHYLTTRQFYDNFLSNNPARSKFQAFARSLEHDLIKAGAVPVGTVHTYRDGGKYKKIADGKWAPVEGQSDRMKTWLTHQNPDYQRQANQEIERHGTQVTALEDMLKRRQGEAKTMDEMKQKITKDIMSKVKDAMSKLYDGKMPKEMNDHFDKMSESESKVDSKAALKELSEKMQSRSLPKHQVSVKFLHNGKKYEHTFNHIEANGHHDAISKVGDALKQKLKGAQLVGAEARAMPEEKKNQSQQSADQPSGGH